MPSFIKTPTIVTNGLVLYIDPANKKSTGNRINVLSNSENLSNAVWLTSNTTVVSNTASNYLGQLVADKVVAASVSAFHSIYQQINMSDNTAYTFTTEMKAAEYNFGYIFITINNTAYTEATAMINLTTGSISTVSNTLSTPVVTSLANSWWRLSMTFNSGEGQTLAGNSMPRVGIQFLPTASVASYQGNGVSGGYVGMTQLEYGRGFTSYQSTTGYTQINSLVGTASITLDRYQQIDINNGGSIKPQSSNVSTLPINTTITLTEWTLSFWFKISKFSPNNNVNQNGTGISLTNKLTGGFPQCVISLNNTRFFVVSWVIVDASNNILIAGIFNEFRSATAQLLVRINNNGTLDTTTTALNTIMLGIANTFGVIQVYTVKLSSSGKYYYSGTNVGYIQRLNSDLTADATFVAAANFNNSVTTNFYVDDTNNKVYVLGNFTLPTPTIAKLNSGGTADATFNAVGTGLNVNSALGIDMNVAKTIVYVGGNFTAYNGTTSNRIVALNASDGSIYATFNVGTGFGAQVNNIYVDANDKVYVVGQFTAYNGTAANRIVRLNTDGSIDTNFVYGTGFNGAVTSLVVTATAIYAGGNFTSYNGTTVSYVVKLSTTGTLDTTFNTGLGTGFTTTSGTSTVGVSSMAFDSNGMLVIVGGFSLFNGTRVNNIVRLNGTTGAIDNYFGSSTINTLNGITDGMFRIIGFDTYFTNAANNATVYNLVSFGTSFTPTSFNPQNRYPYSQLLGYHNTFCNVVITVDSSKFLRLYVNGMIQNTVDLSAITPTLVYNGIVSFLGYYITDLKIYNRALSQAEINQNYRAFINRFR